MKYVALLRGINVGGKNMIKMADLKLCFETLGFERVTTYIQSGNVIFESSDSDVDGLTRKVENMIEKCFAAKILVVILSQVQLRRIIDNVPVGWMQDAGWKYNYLFLKKPYDMHDVVAAVGELKPDIEAMTPGEGVLYQSMSRQLFGRTTTGKLASKPVYQLMTIRNHNTVTKLLGLMEQSS